MPTTTIPQTVPVSAPDAHHLFRPRRVQFDYSATPHQWLPDDPRTMHVFNVLHLLLPAGEDWFCDVYRTALPHITDDDLRRDVKAFIGQEATHARAHSIVLDHLDAIGIDHRPFTRVVRGGFHQVRPRTAPGWLPAPIARWLERQYLLDQLAGIAAIEHFTAVMGWWMLMSPGLDDAGADEQMLGLLRWHGAEEVEHRSVAFDAYGALGGGYLRRVLWMLVVFAGIFSIWGAGTEFLLRKDPAVPRGTHISLRHFVRGGKRGVLPTTPDLIRAVPRYLRRNYHPSDEGRTEVAAAYLADAIGVKARGAQAA